MYCDKCGVKLSPYLSKCPLCNKKLKDQYDEDNGLYSEDIEYLPKEINLFYFSKLIMTILIISTIITIICNLAINKTISWSLYAVFSCIYLCSYYFFIISSKKRICIIINVINLELLLFISAYLNNGLSWYLCLVLPFILLAAGLILVISIIIKLKNVFRNFAYFLTYIAIMVFLINGFISLYKTSLFHLNWSYYANIPLLLVSIILYILSFNKRIMLEVEKRLFI